MKVTCLQENLLRALTLINRIVPAKSQLPILSHVMLSAKNNSFSLSATDLEIGLKLETPAKIEEPGEITIPARVFLELVATLQAGKIVLTQEETTLSLRAENHRATFQGIPASEFPSFADNGKNRVLHLKAESLRGVLESVVFAAATDEGRPVLTGVLLKSEKGECVFVATDGYRLSLKKTSGGAASGKDMVLIVPARVLKELRLLIEKEAVGDDPSVDFFFTAQQNQIVFRVGGGILLGRLIEGDFPNYEKIIPQTATTKVTIEKETFLRAVKTASIFARESANIVRIAMKDEGIFLSANAPQVGENQSFVDAKIEGAENEIAFNSRFLLEFLTNVAGDELVFEMTGPLNPGVFKVKNDDSYLHLIMPVRVQE